MNKHANSGTWKQGQPSANPKGRPPKGYSISDMMKEMLGNEPNIKKAIGQKIIDLAKAGDMVAIKTLWQYMDGMPQQKTDITSGGKPIPLLDYAKTRNNNSDEEDSGSQ